MKYYELKAIYEFFHLNPPKHGFCCKDNKYFKQKRQQNGTKQNRWQKYAQCNIPMDLWDDDADKLRPNFQKP